MTYQCRRWSNDDSECMYNWQGKIYEMQRDYMGVDDGKTSSSDWACRINKIIPVCVKKRLKAKDNKRTAHQARASRLGEQYLQKVR